MQKDDALGLGGKVRRARRQRVERIDDRGRTGLAGEHAGQGKRTDAKRPRLPQKRAAGLELGVGC